MRALLLETEPTIANMPQPVPANDEALVRVIMAGICKTDLEIMKGYMGFKGVPGHEFVGVVEESKDPSLKGKRVVGEINCSCRHCRYCQMEMPNHCLGRTVLGIENRNGAFAEYLTLPEENLHLVPDTISDESAVFTEPTAAAFRILEQITLLKAERVVVLGDGKLGQLVAQVLSLETQNLLVVGKHPWKLQLLNDLEIATALDSDPIEPGADVVVEVTGSPGGLTRALEIVRPEGKIVLKTTITHPTAMELSLPVINEVTIVGSRCGPFRLALDALADGSIHVTPMITETYGLDDALHAFQRAAAPDVMKVLLQP